MKAKLWYNNRKAEKNTRFQWTFHRLPGGLRNDSSQKTRLSSSQNQNLKETGIPICGMKR